MDITAFIPMIFGALVLMIFGIYTLSRTKRRYKDIYGFNLPGWEVVTDDQLLYEIELLFTQGIVNKVMRHTGYQVGDYHSNLKLKNEACFTGFMQLTKSITVRTLDFDDNGFMDYGWANLDSQADRYFYSKLSHPAPAFLHANSKLLGPNLPAHFQAIQSQLQKFEELFGFQNWDLIIYQQDLIILVPEIFDTQILTTFLETAVRLTKTLNGIS